MRAPKAKHASKGRDKRLGPDRRVKQRQDFLRIQSSGEKYRTKHLLLVVSERQSGDSRIGITITTKIDKRAARRNRLKRRLRELFRHERPRFQRSVDLVVIALEGACELDFIQAAKQFKYLLYRSKVLAERSGGKRSKQRANKPQRKKK